MNQSAYTTTEMDTFLSGTFWSRLRGYLSAHRSSRPTHVVRRNDGNLSEREYAHSFAEMDIPESGNQEHKVDTGWSGSAGKGVPGSSDAPYRGDTVYVRVSKGQPASELDRIADAHVVLATTGIAVIITWAVAFLFYVFGHVPHWVWYCLCAHTVMMFTSGFVASSLIRSMREPIVQAPEIDLPKKPE